MSELEIKNAIIKSADICIERGGILDAQLVLSYGFAQQGFGGWALYLGETYDNHELSSVAGHHLFRIMEISGVTIWDDLPGRTIRVEGDWNGIKRIGHVVKDDWYCPSEDFAKARNQPQS